MGAINWGTNVFDAQRGHLFTWVPVCFALGIGLYFSVLVEPDLWVYCLLILTACGLAVVVYCAPSPLDVFAFAGILVIFGLCYMGARAHYIAAPVLEFRYYGPVEGRVILRDRSSSDRIRLTLDQVRLDGVPSERRPTHVRISLLGDAAVAAGGLGVGALVMTTAHLSPPSSPVEPGAFDFRRYAWFQQLGAIGYSRVPVVLRGEADTTVVQRLRGRVSAYLRQALPGDVGAVAAALAVGDRSYITQDIWDTLRRSNLAHLLAISGLHMGLFTGVVFSSLRVFLSLWPRLALRLNVKSWAAAGALVAGGGYLVMSGGAVATERAFVMVAVMLIATMMDRQAITVRALALAAMIVLLRRPESLLNAGFQMSFAATLALIFVFGALRDWRAKTQWPRVPKIVIWGAGVFISSLVAGAATAPFGAAHFNVVSRYGLAANLLAVPVMGGAVAPAAVLSLVLSAIGLQSLGLWIVGGGISYIIWVADWVAGWTGAQAAVVIPPPWVLPVMSLGALFVVLWQGRLRWLGGLPVAIACVAWTAAGATMNSRPEVLIAQDGGLVGVMTSQGRALSRAKTKAFAADAWRRHDGDAASQEVAAQRWPVGATQVLRTIPYGAGEIIHVIGKRGAAQITNCTKGQIIVTNQPSNIAGDCEIFDPARLRVSGSVAYRGQGQLVTAADIAGDRFWTSRGLREWTFQSSISGQDFGQ